MLNSIVAAQVTTHRFRILIRYPRTVVWVLPYLTLVKGKERKVYIVEKYEKCPNLATPCLLGTFPFAAPLHRMH